MNEFNQEDVLRGTGSGERDWQDVEKSINTLPDTPTQGQAIESPYQKEYNGEDAPPQGGVIISIPLIGGSMGISAATMAEIGVILSAVLSSLPKLITDAEALFGSGNGTVKKAAVIGDALKVAATTAAAASQGGQATTLDKYVPIISTTIDQVVAAMSTPTETVAPTS